MNAKLLRLLFVSQFLLAMVAIFIAWPEIGGQAVEDMFWGWKLAFGCALAAAIVGLSAALIDGERAITLRSARWAAAILALIAGMGTLTYYYSLEEDNGDSDDSTTLSLVVSSKCAPLRAA